MCYVVEDMHNGCVVSKLTGMQGTNYSYISLVQVFFTSIYLIKGVLITRVCFARCFKEHPHQTVRRREL